MWASTPTRSTHLTPPHCAGSTSPLPSHPHGTNRPGDGRDAQPGPSLVGWTQAWPLLPTEGFSSLGLSVPVSAVREMMPGSVPCYPESQVARFGSHVLQLRAVSWNKGLHLESRRGPGLWVGP